MTTPMPGPVTTPAPPLRRLLDRAVTEGGVPGILAELRTEHGRWSGTAGAADTATGAGRDPEHRYRIGSTTKTFVATVVLLLAAEGRLSLDDTVATWLPGLVTGNGHDGTKVTIRRLLDHTSGIFSHTGDPEAVNVHEHPTPEQLVRVAMAHPPAFAPGAGWAYSNTNYVLAGMIVERVTGHDLAEEIARRITGPLGLSGTYLPRDDDPVIQGPHSRHYTKLFRPEPDAEILDATELNPAPFWASGDMISTAGDLTRFFAALLGGRLLPPEQQREMFTTVATRDWLADSRYGLGVSVLTLPCGAEVWGMGGAIFGSYSYAYGTRDGRRVLAVNVNGDWATGPWQDPIGIFTDMLHAEFCQD
ncbi:D-alanyl-D-alanine carboxypeptidase [Thermocatellispora tengchongensis]|uniref:D-alanyl-D-alanine carboxypeptidase n=1 Tax=Thermocatellispora tengchongensis TaxID=1073253 RepID=A0A840PLA8_9ACTN|nr:serine hydrolase domain-containing protein [Thermocatellispora tengchongensis]MBB5138581.1 D-alanyl-D-alanine carboxypeptidase [Thermocatellispora tengchongensis]